MDKRLHTDSRTSENFSESGLEKLTGQSRYQWLRYLTKELIDNALETIESPDINVTIEAANVGESYERISCFSVRDNGQGITEDNIHSIFENINVFSSSKRHYKNITRGSQGNALKTVLGIQQLQDIPLIVRSNDKEYSITIKEDILTGNRVAEIQKTIIDDIKGFEIVLRGNLNDYGSCNSVYNSIIHFVELNPQASFNLTINSPGSPEDYNFQSVKDNTNKINKINLGKATTGKVSWFSYSDFVERIKADLRINPDMNLRDFVSEFFGLTSDKKQTSVMKSMGNIKKLSQLINNQDINAEATGKLYQAMSEHTESFNVNNLKNTLGSLGENNLKHGLIESLNFTGRIEHINIMRELLEHKDIEHDINDLIVYYSEGNIIKSLYKEIPYYFELIAIPINHKKTNEDETTECILTFGINQSFIYTTPKVDLIIENNGKMKSYRTIESVFENLGYDFKVICNLFCPNVEFQDKGKQVFNIEPFNETIQKVVNKAYNKLKLTVIKNLNKLNDSKIEYEPEEIRGKAPKGFLKEFINDNFMKVYNEATDNGKYIITLRQFYYQMRPLFYQVANENGYIYSNDSKTGNLKEIELSYRTFTDYVDDYEKEVLNKRIIYKKDRGFAVEPHSNIRIDLGTACVNKYIPDLNQYGNMLFIEKSGFYELLHNDFQLTKKYDLLLINAEGFGTNATRDLIQKIQILNPNIKLYTLTDFDIKGLGIARNIKKPDELSVVDIEEFKCERIGVTFEDIEKYNLEKEYAKYEKSTLSELNKRYEAGEIDTETYNFFKNNQRVEINVFSPKQLEKYLIDKFTELNIKKVKPSVDEVEQLNPIDLEEIRKDKIYQAIGEFILSQCEDDIFNSLDKLIQLPTGKLDSYSQEEIHQNIIKELDNYPATNWKGINENILNNIRAEQDTEIRRYGQEIMDNAFKLLNNLKVNIDVSNLSK